MKEYNLRSGYNLFLSPRAKEAKAGAVAAREQANKRSGMTSQ